MVPVEPIKLLETALKNGKGLYNFTQGGELYLLLDGLAGLEGKAASRAIDDARDSKYPRDQLNQAEGILRLAYENIARPQGHPSSATLLAPWLSRLVR